MSVWWVYTHKQTGERRLLGALEHHNTVQRLGAALPRQFTAESFGTLAAAQRRRIEGLDQVAAEELGYRAPKSDVNPFDRVEHWELFEAWEEGRQQAYHDEGVERAERGEPEDTPCLDPPWWAFP